MSASQRCTAWFTLLLIGTSWSAPLDHDRIYFPGEDPEIYGVPSREVPSDLLPNQVTYMNAEQYANPVTSWLQHGKHGAAGQVTMEGPSIYHTEEQLHGGLQSQPISWEAKNGVPYSAIGAPQEALSFGASRGSSYQHSSTSHGATSYLSSGPLHQGEVYSDLTQSDLSHGGHKTAKHTWTSSHFSASGIGHSGYDGQKGIQPQESVHKDSLLGQSVGSSEHLTGSQDLTSILDGQFVPHSSSSVHPNIHKAFTNVIRDLGAQQMKPLHHTEHKISHVTKTSVQDLGKAPIHKQSTSSNDDISLSNLIEQLRELEQSPQHINITWCEEKIKEFLRALRHKQASGININQQVQEQTLHQILTHEAVESNHNYREEVHEPLIYKVTIRPLGLEDTDHSRQASNITSHEQQIHDLEIADANPGLLIHTSQEDLQHSQEPDIVTVIPHSAPKEPEIMSHQQELPHESTPFISDNTDDLKDLELELPEYMTFEHAHPSKTDAEDSSMQSEGKKLLTHLPANPKISTGQETLDSTPVKISDGTVDVQDTQLHGSVAEQSASQHNLAVTSGATNIVGQQGAETDLTHPEVSSSYQNGQEFGGQKSILEEEQARGRIPSDEVFNHDGQQEGQEYDGAIESHHRIHGRPQAPSEGASRNAMRVNHEEQLMQTDYSRQNPEEVTKNFTLGSHYSEAHKSNYVSVQSLHTQQINYDTLIEELIQLESIPGHQAIDKCEEKIQEFLEILKYQQEQGFGRNQQELENLHNTLIEQAKERGKLLAQSNSDTSTLPPTSFWKTVQKKLRRTYDSAKHRAKEVLG